MWLLRNARTLTVKYVLRALGLRRAPAIGIPARCWLHKTRSAGPLRLLTFSLDDHLARREVQVRFGYWRGNRVVHLRGSHG